MTVTAYGTYPQAQQHGLLFSLASFITNLLHPASPPPTGLEAGKRQDLPLLQVGLAASLPQLSGGVPQGYLRLLVFDKDSVLLRDQCRVVQLTQAAHGGYVQLRVQAILPQDGYVTAYVGSQSDIDVFFDDISVEHRQGLQIQENQYDPWGQNLVGINSSSLNTKELNQYQFNGKERENDLGLGWSDYGWRMYDQQLGRWNAIDLKSEKFYSQNPYNYAFNNPALVVDLDGQEGIVVIGQPGQDHKNKNHFIDNGLSRASKLAKQFRREGKGERATILVYRGKDGSASFSDKQISKLQADAKKAGVDVRNVSSGNEVVDYVNNKTGGNSRDEDLVSNFTYVGHATPGDLEIGWEGHATIALSQLFYEKISIDSFHSQAFSANSVGDLVAACRTAIDNLYQKSAGEQLADKVGSSVRASDVRVNFPGGVATDNQLLKSNNGHVIIIQGRGGISKQGVGDSKKK